MEITIIKGTTPVRKDGEVVGHKPFTTKIKCDLAEYITKRYNPVFEGKILSIVVEEISAEEFEAMPYHVDIK